MTLHSNTFEAKEKTYTLLPSNDTAESLFDGTPFPSSSVLKLIGEKGVKKIDEILKGAKRAKEMIYGVNSEKVAFDSLQYFANVEADFDLLDIQKIFKDKILLICEATSVHFSEHEGLNDEKLAEIPEDHYFEDGRDYHIYTTSDFKTHQNGVPVSRGYRTEEKQHCLEVADGNIDAIARITGTKFLSDRDETFYPDQVEKFRDKKDLDYFDQIKDSLSPIKKDHIEPK